MVAPRTKSLPNRRVVCSIIRIPADRERPTQRDGRPSDLLPWADPYISQLVTQLQQEVRRERPPVARMIRPDVPVCDLDPPAPEFDRRPTAGDWDDRTVPHGPATDRFVDNGTE